MIFNVSDTEKVLCIFADSYFFFLASFKKGKLTENASKSFRSITRLWCRPTKLNFITNKRTASYRDRTAQSIYGCMDIDTYSRMLFDSHSAPGAFLNNNSSKIARIYLTAGKHLCNTAIYNILHFMLLDVLCLLLFSVIAIALYSCCCCSYHHHHRHHCYSHRRCLSPALLSHDYY